MADKKKTKKQNPIQRYFRETIGELKKVSWPTGRERNQLTVIVLVVMVVMGAILAGIDRLATELLKLLLGS